MELNFAEAIGDKKVSISSTNNDTGGSGKGESLHMVRSARHKDSAVNTNFTFPLLENNVIMFFTCYVFP